MLVNPRDRADLRKRLAERLSVQLHHENLSVSRSGDACLAATYRDESRFCTLVKVSGKDAAAVMAALIQHVQQLPAALRRSLTWDRGLEMAQHKSFTMATDVQVYFCDPQSPWQRGSNENTNGLLRQYLPKKADLSCYSQAELDEIALRLNQRPRKTLGFQTPADKLQASVASTP
jgi:IS30 family transposase